MKKTRRYFGFESRHEPLLGRAAFARRLGICFAIAMLLIGVSLFVGMIGYHVLESMPWIDAFTSASMILSGMGPVAPLQTWGGKLFAGLYALYSGLALIAAAGLMMAPLLHRMLHRFHVES